MTSSKWRLLDGQFVLLDSVSFTSTLSRAEPERAARSQVLRSAQETLNAQRAS
jgi:hypothetical protein